MPRPLAPHSTVKETDLCRAACILTGHVQREEIGPGAGPLTLGSARWWLPLRLAETIPLSPALLSALKCRSPAAVLLVPRSAAQRSCCGPAAQAAAEPLGDSLSCHFLCVAPGLLAGSPVCVRGLGVGSAAALQRRPPGRGPLQGRRAFHVAGGAPHAMQTHA